MHTPFYCSNHRWNSCRWRPLVFRPVRSCYFYLFCPAFIAMCLHFTGRRHFEILSPLIHRALRTSFCFLRSLFCVRVSHSAAFMVVALHGPRAVCVPVILLFSVICFVATPYVVILMLCVYWSYGTSGSLYLAGECIVLLSECLSQHRFLSSIVSPPRIRNSIDQIRRILGRDWVCDVVLGCLAPVAP